MKPRKKIKLFLFKLKSVTGVCERDLLGAAYIMINIGNWMIILFLLVGIHTDVCARIAINIIYRYIDTGRKISVKYAVSSFLFVLLIIADF